MSYDTLLIKKLEELHAKKQKDSTVVVEETVVSQQTQQDISQQLLALNVFLQ